MFNIKSFEEIIDYFNNIESNNSLKFEIKFNEYLYSPELYILFKSKYTKEIYKHKTNIDINNINPDLVINYYLKIMDDYIIEDIQDKSKRCFIFDNELPTKQWKKYINN
jgi:hypothetical protein